MLMRFEPWSDPRFAASRTKPNGNGRSYTAPSAMAMDAYRRGEQFVLEFDLPGVDPSAIDLTVEKNVLTIAAERQWSPAEGDQVVAAERRHGGYRRQLFLGDSLDLNAIAASYEQGVLRLIIPVAETSKPRKIEIASEAREMALN